MWLIQWATENGLEWLISDGTVIGFAAVHPFQFLLLVIVCLALGTVFGFFLRGKTTSVEVAKIKASAEAEVMKARELDRIETEKREREADEERQRKAAREKEEEEKERRFILGEISHSDIVIRAMICVMVDDGHVEVGSSRDEGWDYAEEEINRLLHLFDDYGIVEYETTFDGKLRWRLTDSARSAIESCPGILDEGRKFLDSGLDSDDE